MPRWCPDDRGRFHRRPFYRAEEIDAECEALLADFRRAFMEGGLSREEFDMFPPTRRTLRQFIAACHDLDGQIRELMLPNPDVTIE